MTTSYKNITEKAVRSIGSVSAVARKFNFKSLTVSSKLDYPKPSSKRASDKAL
ncbi:Uncharacterised protein [Enterobacter asburiae]|uniref:Uncharacterized protein n=1 Tax=Enterobacter asburiae TaxID=61645 RepID=A0A376FA55_ENTAS|nr:Uncharacterised protein [Enterobacter asburiae]